MGVTVNYDTAIQWYEKALAKKHSASAKGIERCRKAKSGGLEKDVDEAVEAIEDLIDFIEDAMDE